MYTNNGEDEQFINPTPFIEEVFRSRLLSNIFGSLDNHVLGMEREIEQLAKERDEWRGKYFEEIDKQLSQGQNMMANVLKACISTPSISSIGPVGATIIVKIREMKTIEEVREYIQTIVEDNKEELEQIGESIKDK